ARRGLDIARRAGDPGGVMMGLRATAILTAPFDPDEAYRLIDEAIASAQQHGDLAEVARNRIVKGRMSWKLGLRSRAIADSLAALDAVEAERDLQEDALVKAWRFSAWRTPYFELSGHLLSGHLLEPGSSPPSRQDLALAFAVIERMRARMLLDTMDAAHATAAVAPRTPLAEEHGALLKQVAGLRRRLLDPALPASERSRATEELQRLASQEASSRAALAAAAPRFGALRAPHLASLDDVAAALDEDQALLSFQISLDHASDQTFLGGSWLLVITRAAAKAYRLPLYETIWTRVPVFTGLLARRDGSQAEGSVRVYQDLLAAALADLPASVTRLLILPDGPLHHLPFDALQPARAAPMAMRYEIAIAPSATAWLRWKQTPQRTSSFPALVFADPDLTGVSRQPDPKSRTRDVLLGDLPRAREEGIDVARDLGGGSECFVGAKATESRLKSADLSSFGILHFASHAVIDTVFPDRSAVLLARGSPEEDGWLRPRDIVNLNLSGQVVVLSACQTASGALIEGEGVTGLSHAFFEAGAHAVIASLWPLRDDEAAATFERFYRHLAGGLTVGQAVAATRRDEIRAGLPPAVWASLELIGDADARPVVAVPKSTSKIAGGRFLPLLAVGLALSIGALVLARIRR
ncbi:MAG TPA: CHAT domain-containing protein, partial [Thermoanaerobaculia bacterium]|nr:CHAT domain-containing protein [Thermoanaerobaculia bacterium]